MSIRLSLKFPTFSVLSNCVFFSTMFGHVLCYPSHRQICTYLHLLFTFCFPVSETKTEVKCDDLPTLDSSVVNGASVTCDMVVRFQVQVDSFWLADHHNSHLWTYSIHTQYRHDIDIAQVLYLVLVWFPPVKCEGRVNCKHIDFPNRTAT